MNSIEEEMKTLLQDLKDEDIDTSDIPEVLDWSNAERGKFYRPQNKLNKRSERDSLEEGKAPMQ